MQMSANAIWNGGVEEKNLCNPRRKALPANASLNWQIL